jgi:hypothetical protein
MLNGMKIIKKWSPANMFSASFLIVIACSAVLLALLAWVPITMVITPTAEAGLVSGETINISFTGYEYIKEFISTLLGSGTPFAGWSDLTNSTAGGAVKLNFLMEQISISAFGPTLAPMIYNVVVIWIISTLALTAIMSVISLLTGLIGFLSGRLYNFASYPKIAWWSFTFVLLEALIPIASLILLPMFFNNFEVKADIDGTLTSIMTINSMNSEPWMQIGIAGGTLVIAIIISVIYFKSFKNAIYVKNVDALLAAKAKRDQAQGNFPGFGSQTVNGYDPSKQNAVTQEVKKESKPVKSNKQENVKLDKLKGLPEGLTIIGGHAFSKNTELEIAIVPLGIVEIGASAFSNCINLQIVSLPETIKKIDYNAFFGCTRLTRFTYGGKKSEWREIERGSNWLASSGTTMVICSDGAITVNPYH